VANTINGYTAITLQSQRVFTGIHYAGVNRGYAEGYAMHGDLVLDTDGDWSVIDPTVGNTQVANPLTQRVFIVAISLIAVSNFSLTFRQQVGTGAITAISPTYVLAAGSPFQANYGTGVLCSTARGARLIITTSGVNTGAPQGIGLGYLFADDYIVR